MKNEWISSKNLLDLKTIWLVIWETLDSLLMRDQWMRTIALANWKRVRNKAKRDFRHSNKRWWQVLTTETLLSTTTGAFPSISSSRELRQWVTIFLFICKTSAIEWVWRRIPLKHLKKIIREKEDSSILLALWIPEKISVLKVPMLKQRLATAREKEISPSINFWANSDTSKTTEFLKRKESDHGTSRRQRNNFLIQTVMRSDEKVNYLTTLFLNGIYY